MSSDLVPFLILFVCPALVFGGPIVYIVWRMADAWWWDRARRYAILEQRRREREGRR